MAHYGQIAQAGASMYENSPLRQLMSAFVPNICTFVTRAGDKIGFDLDVIGRKRMIMWIEQQARVAYGNSVNVAVWNMHVPVDEYFDQIYETGLVKMGEGGGFRVVVFKGPGYLRNNGARGFDNWCGSGNQTINGNCITFYQCNPFG